MIDSNVFRGFGPRSMFYSARDLLLDNPQAPKTAVVGEQSTRQQLANEAIRATELLISSLRATKPFDDLGNVELTVPQIEEARANALLRINNLLEAVERTNSRVRKHANADAEKPAAGPTAPGLLSAIIGTQPAGKVERIELTSILPTPADLLHTFNSSQAAMRGRA